MSRFLVDQNVNQKAIRGIDRLKKGFDVLLPQDGNFSNATDPAVRKLAEVQARTIVTCDKDFTRFNLAPSDVPAGVLILRPPKRSQKRVTEILSKLCAFLLTNFPQDPYNFGGKIFEVYEDHIDIIDSNGLVTHTF